MLKVSRLYEIDFIKGVAILSVLFLHTLNSDVRSTIFSQIHIGQAVPIFIAVSFLLSFRYLDKSQDCISDWFKLRRIKILFKRIIAPFVLLLLIQILVMHAAGRNDLIFKLINRGGTGQGRTIYGFTYSFGY